MAAAIRLPRPEVRTPSQGLLFHGLRRTNGPYRQAVSLLELLPQFSGFGEQQAGVEGEHTDGQPLLGNHVDQDATFDAESGAESNARREGIGRPRKNFGGGPVL